MSSSTPTFEESYPLLTLPRIPDLALGAKIAIPRIQSIETSVIDIGISKSIISSYIIKPTPKLIWSYALSPTSVVDSMDVVEVDGGVKLYAIGITDRKKHKLVILERSERTGADGSSGSEVETSDGHTNVATAEVKVGSKTAGIRLFNRGTLIAVVYSNGSVEVFKKEKDEAMEVEGETQGESRWSSTGPAFVPAVKGEKLVYHEYITDIRTNTVVQAGGNKDLLLLVFQTDAHIVYRLVSLNFQTGLFEISSSSAEFRPRGQFAYNSGYLYQYNSENATIDTVSITNFKTVRSTNIHGLLADSNPDSVSIISPAPDRVIFTAGNKIHLINTRYASLLHTYESSTGGDPDTLALAQVVNVNGNSLRTMHSMVCYLNQKTKENNVDLNVINVNVGLNNLSECLGKGIKSPEISTPSFHGLANLADENFTEQISQLTQELTEVYHTLQTFRDAKDFAKWERTLVPYLKMESWSSIQTSLKKQKSSKSPKKSYNFQEFDIETDRTVDSAFIHKVLGLIFKTDATTSEIQFQDDEFIPEFTLIYLLTNPIFPQKYTNGLLQLLYHSNQLTLLRQAIITCPNLTAREILAQIINFNSDTDFNTQIFEDLINRIIGEFSVQEITAKFKQLIQSTEAEAESSTNLDSLLNRLLQVKYNNNSWLFIELLIDVGGLFSWSPETVDTLSELIETKVASLVENSYNLTLANQAILVGEPVAFKPKRHSKKLGNDSDIVPVNQQASQLESILTIKNNTNNRYLLGGSSHKKVPKYSIERLVI